MDQPSLRLGQGGVLKKSFILQEFKKFAELTGDHNPIHTDPSFSAMSRFGRPVCHGMLLYGLINRVIGSQVPGPSSLQKKQTLTFPYPTYPDEKITAQVWITDIKNKNICDMNTVISKQNGNMTTQGKTTVFLPEEGFKNGPIEDFDEKPNAEKISYKGMEVGETKKISRRFSEKDVEERSNLTGDANPVFLSRKFAEEVGFDRQLIPGDLLGSIISNILGTKLPGLGTNWLKQEFRFLNPAYVGEKITGKVEITRIRPEKDLVYLKNTCKSSDGTTILRGKSLVLVKDLKQS